MRTYDERLLAMYADHDAAAITCVALARAGVSVSTHGRVCIKGKVTRGTRHGASYRVQIAGKKHCVRQLVRRVWMSAAHTTGLEHELWSHTY